jgi:hypothetical protein
MLTDFAKANPAADRKKMIDILRDVDPQDLEKDAQSYVAIKDILAVDQALAQRPVADLSEHGGRLLSELVERGARRESFFS